ncbi:uncharacterized protein LOC142981275 [Anticarsia gemmatalis]|uniref:uncharacterized protein LOC142981275 n=1 Tax=Anticarsia gemmatalis TaxID=129554 RepID=UPI003F77523C
MFRLLWESVVIITLTSTVRIKCDFHECHVDPSLTPEEGPLEELHFTWLAALQYIHIEKGNPHYTRVPRVVLVSPQYTLCTAYDAVNVPEGYALGNIAFDVYERDESECGISASDYSAGAECDSSVMIMPISDVVVHPDYTRYKFVDSVALLKLLQPLKSRYMLPVCLPFMNFLVDKKGHLLLEDFMHIDFASAAPRNFGDEDKELDIVTLVANDRCPQNTTNTNMPKTVCSTRCGFVSGSPLIVHEVSGYWTVVALSLGGNLCADPLRVSNPTQLPSQHIAIYPYVNWITETISGRSLDELSKDDPFGYGILRSGNASGTERDRKWVGHWWMAGLKCFFRDYFKECRRFYYEIFKIKPKTDEDKHHSIFFDYFLELEAPPGYKIICLKVNLPYTYVEPTVWELGSPLVRVRIPLLPIKHAYILRVEAWHQRLLEEESDETEEDFK